MKQFSFYLVIILFGSYCFSCGTKPQQAEIEQVISPLKSYVNAEDSIYRYELVETKKLEGHTFHVLKMYSQQWLTDSLVNDPVWWHYINLVVPDEIKSEKALLVISGGDRKSKVAEDGGALLTRAALSAGTVTAEVKNVPNQPLEFNGDSFSPRKEDEIIAYGWRKFLEKGADPVDATWLARLPMTKSAVKAMDAVSDFVSDTYGKNVDKYVVAGASKRGWTTWTTAISDPRVIAIAPIVIDLLNLEPSFQHHWRAYGLWAPAVNNYVQEGIMEWMGSDEFDQLLATTEPFSYLDDLKIPKFIINSTGDQFFLPDSWKFYYDKLPGKKLLRYIPNSDHSLKRTDAVFSLISYYNAIVNDQPLPDYKWTIENGVTYLRTDPENPPQEIKLWQATNAEARDFRREIVGDIWQPKLVELTSAGSYQFGLDKPEKGWSAYFVELTYDLPVSPLKVTTGVVVVPDIYPHQPFVANPPKDKKLEAAVEIN